MKRIIKYLLLMFLLIPLFINAEVSTHETSVSKANNYIMSDSFNSRSKYLLLSSPLSADTSYRNGGLLTKNDYLMTSHNGDSWLIIPNKFWLETLVGSGNYYYIDGRELAISSSNAEKYETRVTEYVKPGTKVTGTGTITIPWEFENANYATLSVNDKETAYFYDGEETDSLDLRKTSKEVMINGGEATFTINVKKGYKNDPSDGCNLVKQSNEQSYTNSNKITYKINNLSKDYNCVAKFMIDEYKITYNLNNGSLANGVTNPNLYTVVTPDFTLNNPSKNGYNFAGWTGSNGSTKQTTVTIQKGTTTGDKSYTANYSAIEYSISYNLNSGSVSGNPNKYTIETNTFTLKNPSRTGYDFTGWTGSNGSTKQTTVSIAKGSTGNKSYTANWQQNTYTVTYNKNTSKTVSSMPSNQTKQHNVNLTLSNNTPTADKLKFNGWNTKSDGTGTNYSKGGTYSTNANVTLYAKWKNCHWENVGVCCQCCTGCWWCCNPGGQTYDWSQGACMALKCD